MALGCGDRRPLAELPDPPTRLAAVLVVHARDCDSNLQLFDVMDRADVRRGMPLVGVVSLDDVDHDVTIRRALRAFDVGAPLLTVSRSTRDSLRALTGDVGMTLVVLRHGDRPVRAVGPPHTPAERLRFMREIITLAADARPQ